MRVNQMMETTLSRGLAGPGACTQRTATGEAASSTYPYYSNSTTTTCSIDIKLKA